MRYFYGSVSVALAYCRTINSNPLLALKGSVSLSVVINNAGVFSKQHIV